ncbi:MAG TPA: hypothetical protein DIW17_12280 [Clostridiales bacterium]|nr:hypothetical protein [Clostridiales bacterium]
MLLAAPRCRDHRIRNCQSPDEVSLLLGSIGRETDDGKRDFAAMSLAATSGLRAGDIASLTLDDMNSDDHLFYVDRKGMRSQMSIDNVEKL